MDAEDHMPPQICDGLHHEWIILLTEPGEPGRAVARCCNVRATRHDGPWAVDTGEVPAADP